jgi:hypothetical protein
MPAEVCYLAKQRPDRQFNSYNKIEHNIAGTRPVRRDGVLVVEPKLISRVERGTLNFKPLPPIKARTFDWDAEFKQHILDQENLFGPQKGAET